MPTDLHERWGQRLRERRTAAGVTPVQLARICGITRQTVWNYEKGRRVVPDDMRIAIARALNTPVETLFPYSDTQDAA